MERNARGRVRPGSLPWETQFRPKSFRHMSQEEIQGLQSVGETQGKEEVGFQHAYSQVQCTPAIKPHTEVPSKMQSSVRPGRVL